MAIELKDIVVGVGVVVTGVALSAYESGIYKDWIGHVRDVCGRLGMGTKTEPFHPSAETLKWKAQGDKIRQSLGIQIIDTYSLK
jgi:hypothetical protein